MNLHYQFWVKYYEENLESDGDLSDNIAGKNRSLTTECKWKVGNHKIPLQENGLLFRVKYPGLLAGLGYAHRCEKADGQIGLGFSLDSVTGLPYLPGSSVKGTLYSAFDFPEYIQSLPAAASLTVEHIKDLQKKIFGDTEAGGQDVFLDAFPVGADNKGNLLGLENITPHVADNPKYRGLTEPKPLTLLKLMPGVVLQFRFLLKETRLDDTHLVTAADKLALFREIIADLGIGAKTNTGFGVLEPVADNKEGYYYLVEQRTVGATVACKESAGNTRPAKFAGKPTHTSGKKPARPTCIEDVQVGMVLQGKVTGIKDYGVFVSYCGKFSGLLKSQNIPQERRGNIQKNNPLTVRVIGKRQDKNGKTLLDFTMMDIPQ